MVGECGLLGVNISVNIYEVKNALISFRVALVDKVRKTRNEKVTKLRNVKGIKF